MQLEGRAAIVTGGAGGLGSATVRRLVDVGMKVVVFDIAGDAARDLAKELGDVAAAVEGDAAHDDACQAAIEGAYSLGVLSLIANVGGGGVGGGATTTRRNCRRGPGDDGHDARDRAARQCRLRE